MEEIINAFHIDIKSIIAQLINFGIVFFVLFKFAYKPLMAKMKERTDIIEKGLSDAKKSQEQLEQAEKIREDKIMEAKKEAKKILEDSQKMAQKNKEEIVASAKEQAVGVVEDAKIQIKNEKENMLKEVKSEVGIVVASALEKVLNKDINADEDKKVIQEAISEINKK